MIEDLIEEDARWTLERIPEVCYSMQCSVIDASLDDKGPKRYSNRTRPKHWNERGSQSPPQHELAQTFDEPLAQADEFRDVLGTLL